MNVDDSIDTFKRALERCNRGDCDDCSYKKYVDCTTQRNKDTIAALTEMEKEISKLKKYVDEKVFEVPIKKYIKQDSSLVIVGITILSKEEYDLYKDAIPLFNNYWWLRSPGSSSPYACIVYDYGARDGNDYDVVDNGENAVRPALIINLESSNLNIGDEFTFADRDWTVISDALAICNSDIGTCPFRDYWAASDANVYEKSDLKRYVEDWFIVATKGE